MSEHDAASSFDADAHRAASRTGWEAAAPGWARRHETISAFAAPVTRRLLDACAPKPGERVLELAAGLGETGMLAAKRVAPHGGVIVSDQADAMLDGARARAEALGLSNVEFQVINAEWIDMPVASVDVVLCRWGYMLMVDPLTALGETRRVLRPGGRLALAVWDSIFENRWAHVPGTVLMGRGLLRSNPKAVGWRPGPFALGDRETLARLLADAGFADVRIEAIDVMQRHAGFDGFWETTLDLSRDFHDAVLGRPEQEIAEIRDEIETALAGCVVADGALEIPGRALVAAASA